MKEGTQLIVRVLCGDAEDTVIIAGAHALNDRAKVLGLKSSVVTFPDLRQEPTTDLNRKRINECKLQLPLLDSSSRLYLCGHGDWQTQCVGGVPPKIMAGVLYEFGLRTVGLISIISCFAGGHGSDAAVHRVSFSTHSFASQFHKRLGKFGVYCVVFARTEKMAVVTDETAEVYARCLEYKGKASEIIGRKVTKTVTDGQGERSFVQPAITATQTKVGFNWQNGEQVMFWRR